MIRVTMPRENIIRALDHAQNRFFVGFPVLAGTRFTAGQKWIGENDRRPDLYLPTGIA